MSIQFAKQATSSMVEPFTPRNNQQEYFIDNPISQLELYYAGTDTRSIVLNAPTGSGKTRSSITGFIPAWVRKFYPLGMSNIAFMTHFSEVVDATERMARKYLDRKKIDTSVGIVEVRVYDSDDIKYHIAKNRPFEGDVVIFLCTASFFNMNVHSFATENGNKKLDLFIVDEAHFRFGTISAEDTKADKGAFNRNFQAVTLTQLREKVGCATLFMTATPTNSQQELTDLGAASNVFLPPFPNDKNTRPAFQFIEYPTNDLTVEEGIEFYGRMLREEVMIRESITDDTWKLLDEQMDKAHSICMLRLGRRGAQNGVDYYENIDRIVQLQKNINSYSLNSTSKNKTFNKKKIDTLATGILLTDEYPDVGICLNVIDSGYAGLDQPRIRNVIIGREPSGTISNNYNQIVGRGGRILYFASHLEAVTFIKNLPVSDEQKRAVIEWYHMKNTTTVHIPMESKLLCEDVRQDYESTTYRPDQLRSLLLNGVFGNSHIPGGIKLVTSISFQDDTYKNFRHHECQVCAKTNGVDTDCFVAVWNALNVYYKRMFTREEVQELWIKTLNVHHSNGNHFDNSTSNLITLCASLHMWITLFEEHYKNRYNHNPLDKPIAV